MKFLNPTFQDQFQVFLVTKNFRFFSWNFFVSFLIRKKWKIFFGKQLSWKKMIDTFSLIQQSDFQRPLVLIYSLYLLFKSVQR